MSMVFLFVQALIFVNMNSNSLVRSFLPLLLIYIITSAICLFVPQPLIQLGIDASVLLIGNVILLTATFISFMFYRRSLTNNHAPFFLRMIYSAMFTKMMICIFSAFIY